MVDGAGSSIDDCIKLCEGHVQGELWVGLSRNADADAILRVMTLSISQAWAHMMGDSRLLLMGLVQVLFEGSMLAWVVIWVPVLEAAPPSQARSHLTHGIHPLFNTIVLMPRLDYWIY